VPEGRPHPGRDGWRAATPVQATCGGPLASLGGALIMVVARL
jgi:hypothetical protein